MASGSGDPPAGEGGDGGDGDREGPDTPIEAAMSYREKALRSLGWALGSLSLTLDILTRFDSSQFECFKCFKMF